MAKIIFRKIGGRIVPIGLSASVKPMPAKGLKEVEVKAHAGLHKIGEVWGQQDLKRPHRFHVGSGIQKEYRGAGIGKEMYKKLGAVIRSLGGKSMVGSTDNVAVVKKVRESVGKTRALQKPHAHGGMTYPTRLVTMLTKKGKK